MKNTTKKEIAAQKRLARLEKELRCGARSWTKQNNSQKLRKQLY